jgi:simple sugar transport system substrate-binding protein
MFQQGQRAAEFLLKKFFDNEKNTIRIIELRGTEGSSPAISRAEGFRETLKNYPEFDIIFSASGDFLRSKGYELMRGILGDFIDIDVIYSHNDSMTLGAIDAIKERGIKPGTDIVIVSIDAEQAAIDALKRGEINCVVECNPMQGPEIMRLAAMLARGERIPRVMYMEEEVFTEWDDLSDIAPRGY